MPDFRPITGRRRGRLRKGAKSYAMRPSSSLGSRSRAWRKAVLRRRAPKVKLKADVFETGEAGARTWRGGMQEIRIETGFPDLQASRLCQLSMQLDSTRARGAPNQVRKEHMNHAMRVAAFLAVLPSAAAYAAGPFDGTFRPNHDSTIHWDCTSIGQDGGAMSIRGNELVGTEWGCLLTDPVRVRGMNALLYNGVCASEGTEYSERIMLMKSEHGVYVIGDGYVLDLIRGN